jgi:hypothetical protein
MKKYGIIRAVTSLRRVSIGVKLAVVHYLADFLHLNTRSDLCPRDGSCEIPITIACDLVELMDNELAIDHCRMLFNSSLIFLKHDVMSQSW